MGGKRERMVVFVIWYSLQRIVNRHRFLKYIQILRNPTTSEGCKNFSRGLGYTLWVSKRSAWIRAFERTYFHGHSMRRSKNFAFFRFFWKKKRLRYLFESDFSNCAGGFFLTWWNFGAQVVLTLLSELSQTVEKKKHIFS